MGRNLKARRCTSSASSVRPCTETLRQPLPPTSSACPSPSAPPELVGRSEQSHSCSSPSVLLSLQAQPLAQLCPQRPSVCWYRRALLEELAVHTRFLRNTSVICLGFTNNIRIQGGDSGAADGAQALRETSHALGLQLFCVLRSELWGGAGGLSACGWTLRARRGGAPGERRAPTALSLGSARDPGPHPFKVGAL